MNTELKILKKEVYDKCDLNITDYKIEKESKEYYACQFKLNEKFIICRNAKVTPKKVGQFVTFWKRNEKKTIEPYKESDNLDFFIVNVATLNEFGQFVFPKSELLKQKIISTDLIEGKRGFRVYPPWDIVKSRQAEQTQLRQTKFFYKVNNLIDLKQVKKLFKEL